MSWETMNVCNLTRRLVAGTAIVLLAAQTLPGSGLTGSLLRAAHAQEGGFDPILRGALDLHAHLDPDGYGRGGSGRSIDLEVFGGLGTNYPTGGLTSAAVRQTADVKGGFGRIVWMPMLREPGFSERELDMLFKENPARVPGLPVQ